MQLLCGKCGRTTEVDDQTLEAVVKCGFCEHEIPVPGRGEDLLGEPEAGGPEEDFARQAREAMERKIRVICGSCGRGLKASMRMAGAVIRCPACDRKVRIPFPDEGQERPTAAEVGAGAPGNGASAAPGGQAQEADDVLVDEAPARNLLSDTEEAQASMPADSLQVAASAPVARVRQVRQRAATGPAVPTWVLLAAVGLALAAVGAWLWLPFLTGKGKPAAPDITAVKTPATTPPATGAGESVKPPVVPPVASGQKQPTQPVKPERAAAVQLAQARCDLFLANGWGAAPAGMAYLKLRLTIQAADEALTVRSAGNDVRLTAGGKTFASLGSPGPFGPVNEALRLGAGAKGTIEAIFLVPEQAMAGGRACEVAVASLPPAAVKGVEVPSGGQLVVGEKYRESPPRNLRPLLRDPVMRAIQAAGDQELLVSRKNGELEVSIPVADVSGPAKPGAGGTYEVTLYRQGDPKGLRCSIRPTKGGRKLLLYLSDEPFHQICYAMPERPSDPPPAVPSNPGSGNGNGGGGGTFFKPSDPKPPVAPPVKDKGPGGTPPRRGGGLFDFGN